VTDYMVEPAWQDEPPAYEKKRAIREHTADCPCDRCEWRSDCQRTGRECAKFKSWCKSGTTKEVK